MAWMSIGLLVLMVFFIAWVVTGYQRLVRLKSLIDAAWREIDMPLKRQAGLVKQLTIWAHGHEALEKNLIGNVEHAEHASKHAHTIDQKAQAELALDSAVLALMVAISKHPNLASQQEFVQLQKDLDETDDAVHLGCRYYNGAVRHYNMLVERYPARIVALLTGFSPVEYFWVNDAPEHRK
jgi:LemA protein